MKPHLLLPPAAALAVVLAAGLSRRNSVLEIQRESAHLRMAIAEAHAHEEMTRASTDPAQPGDAAKPDDVKNIDWAEIATRLAAANNSSPSARGIQEMIRLQNLLLQMSGPEILAALDEIALLDLSPANRTNLENTLIEIYVQMEPADALERFANRIQQESFFNWRLVGALASVAKDNPHAAAAWLDRQIAAGVLTSKSLDGRNDALVSFEAAILDKMLKADPAAALARLNALPGNQKMQALQQTNFTSTDPATHAGLLRGSFPDDESRRQAFSQTGSKLVQDKGFERVDEYLELAGLSADERDAVVEQAASASVLQRFWQSGLVKSRVDETRAWLERQAPATRDQATGKILADAALQGKFDDAVGMALQYHESSGDAVLVSFIENAYRINKDQVRPLVDRISDPQQKAALLEKLK